MPTFRTLGVAAVSVLATLTLTSALTLAGQAAGSVVQHPVAHKSGVPAPPKHPRSDKQIQNIDQVRTAIKGYYGDTVTTQPDPITGTVPLHTFDPDGAYAAQVTRELARAQRFLSTKAVLTKQHRAIVLDVDDTSLNTYSYEIYTNFAYTPASNAAFVNAEVFPAVPGMPQLASSAQSKGYTIFFLTGRPGTQRTATEENLAKVGFPAVPDADVFLKDYVADTWLSSCAPSCTTIQYKSLTRAHIQSLGYQIVANFGDQKSDLRGGHAQRTYKLPNPMYYLP